MRSPPIELLSRGHSLGLPLGLEAPIMTPNGVIFLFLFTLGIHMLTGELCTCLKRPMGNMCIVT